MAPSHTPQEIPFDVISRCTYPARYSISPHPPTMSSTHSNPAQQELAAAIATADGYDTDSSDSLTPDHHQPNDEFFDANDVFYDSNGKRISMRYSLAVYSHDRNSPKSKAIGTDSLARETLREEPDEVDAQAQRPRKEGGNVEEDNLSIAQAQHDGQPVADTYRVPLVPPVPTSTPPNPRSNTAYFTPLPQLPENEHPLSHQFTPSPSSSNPSRASVRRSKSIDPVTLHIQRRTSLLMPHQEAEIPVEVVEHAPVEVTEVLLEAENGEADAGERSSNEGGRANGGAALASSGGAASLPGSRRGSIGSHFSGNAGEGSAEEKDGGDKGQKQKRSILSLMKFGRKRGASTAAATIPPDPADNGEEPRDSDELNQTSAASSTIAMGSLEPETASLSAATIMSQASTASSSTMGGPYGGRYVKMKIKHKSTKSFPRLFLAQTLDTAALALANGTHTHTHTHTPTNSSSTAHQQNAASPASTSSTSTSSTSISQPASAPAPDTAADPLTQGAIWTIKFSRDGKFLASGGQDYVVRVWGVIGVENSGETGMDEAEREAKVFREKPVHEYRGHTADVLDLSWSKNNFLLSSSMDKTVRLWHVSRKECLCVFQHLDFVTAIAFHPRDDRFFLSGSLDCKLRLWNIPEKKVAFWNEVPDAHLITAVGFTLDGKIACAGSYVGLCLFYETDGLRYNTQISVKDQRGRNSKKGRKITGIEPMPNMPPGEEKLLITSNDSRIRLVNMKDKSLECKYKGLENTSSQIKATFSDDGRYIICGSEDHSVCIWNTEQPGFVLPFNQDTQQGSALPVSSRSKTAGTALSALGEQVIHAATSPAGVQTNTGGRVGGWFKKREVISPLPAPIKEKMKGGLESFEAHNQIVTCAIFAPTKTKQFLSADGNDPIYANTPIPISSSDLTPSSPPMSPTASQASSVSSSSLTNTSFTYPDGDIIVTADYTGCIKVWRHDCGSYISQLTGGPSTPNMPLSTASTSTVASLPNGAGGNASPDSTLTSAAKDVASVQQPAPALAVHSPGDPSPPPTKARGGFTGIFYGRKKADKAIKSADDSSMPSSPTTAGPAMTCPSCGGKEFKSFVAVPTTGGEGPEAGEATQKTEMLVCIGCKSVVAGL